MTAASFVSCFTFTQGMAAADTRPSNQILGGPPAFPQALQDDDERGAAGELQRLGRFLAPNFTRGQFPSSALRV